LCPALLEIVSNCGCSQQHGHFEMTMLLTMTTIIVFLPVTEPPLVCGGFG
jgi:hypothetical protein